MVQVTVLGAGGHTGRFVVDALHRHGVSVVGAVRSGGASNDVETRHVSFDQPRSLDEALQGSAAVINCAGPFFDTAQPAAEAAIRAGIPYLDITAEQYTAAQLFRCCDAPARSAGIVLVPAMAFYGGLADLLASALVRPGEPIDVIHVAVALDGWHPTAGTRLTGERNHHQRLIVRAGELVSLDPAEGRRSWRFAEPFGEQEMAPVPLAEIILMNRHLPATEIISFMNEKPLADLRDPATPPPEAVDAQGRSAQRFTMEVEMHVGEEKRRASASGQDIYAITAPLVVSACMELIANPDFPSGVRAPGELFDATAFLKQLAPELITTFSLRA